MRLARLTISNFQSFGEELTVLDLGDMTYILGPNGAGKTAVLQALARMFGTDPGVRRIRPSDFHVPQSEADIPETRTLQIEAHFEVPEFTDSASVHPAIPLFANHMGFASDDGIHRMRIRLWAALDADGEVEEKISYVNQATSVDAAETMIEMSRQDRGAIQVHYIPARRDPSDHVSYAANSLIGRTLRAAKWTAEEREVIHELAKGINWTLEYNGAVDALGAQLRSQWEGLHSGAFFAGPSLAFEQSDVDGLLRRLTVDFAPSPEGGRVNYVRLGDGQKSLLYISLVLAVHTLGREVSSDPSNTAYDIDKLRPAAHTIIAAEEPENSLSPRYLGKVVKALRVFAALDDAQAVVTTHSPALLRRVPPEHIRHLRLDGARQTTIKTITMPSKADDAHKFVREAVQAFPELYFARLVILGEGDSEEIVIPRVLAASSLAEDDASIAVVPLGGRHVNHFWRLLHGLGIPHVTLLDLDLGRHQGGWGRIKYAIDQLVKVSATAVGAADPTKALAASIPAWNSDFDAGAVARLKEALTYLEQFGVYYSRPVDLDFAMLEAYPAAYGIADLGKLKDPDESTVRSVLGKSHGDEAVLRPERLRLFDRYHKLFKVGSKPAAHVQALSTLEDDELLAGLPKVLNRMVDRVCAMLEKLPE